MWRVGERMSVVMKFGGTSVADAEAIDARDRHRPAARSSAEPPSDRRRSSSCRRCRRSPIGWSRSARLAEDGDARPGGRATACDLLERHVAVAAALVAAEPRSTRSTAQLATRVHGADRHGARAGGAARGVAAVARRDCSRSGELASSRIVAAALAEHGVPAAWVDARQVLVTDAEHTAAAPDMDGDLRARARHGRAADRARGEVRGARRLHRRDRRRRHDDARPRRLGLLGGDLRRLPRRRRDSDLDRRRRHAHRRSARRAAAARSCRSCRSPKRRSWPTSAPRCCTRARFCRRSSKNIPVRILNSRRPENAGHADHRRAAAGRRPR